MHDDLRGYGKQWEYNNNDEWENNHYFHNSYSKTKPFKYLNGPSMHSLWYEFDIMSPHFDMKGWWN